MRGPRLTVDVIIRLPSPSGERVVLVKRRFPPPGWALPGGFVDEGETLEAAAVREALEETGLQVRLERQFHAYSDPSRDPRGPTVSIVFLGTASGEPRAGDDAAEVAAFALDELPALAFDHRSILDDYVRGRY